MARKPSATARELLRNFPKGGKGVAGARKAEGPGGGGRERRQAEAEEGRSRGAGRSAEDKRQASENGSEPEVDLAGAEDDAVATGDSDELGPPRRSIPSATPSPPSQEISRPVRASRARQAASTSSRSASTQRSSGSSSARLRRSPLRSARIANTELEAKREIAVSRSSVGNSSRAIVRLRPTPITAQPSCGLRLDQDAGELASIDPDVVGPLDLRTRSPAASSSPFRRRRAGRRAAAAGGARRAAAGPPSRAAPCPAARSRCGPAVPRPAVCSSAVTTVPPGAPASTSSRARALVESVTRKWRCGVPKLMR